MAEIVALREKERVERHEERHRLRNMLSVLRAVARQTGEDVQTIEEYGGVLDGRLSSYLRVQAAVMPDWSRGIDLAMLLSDELLRFGLKEGDQARLSGPAIRLTSRAAGLLALAFHELASAAILSSHLDMEGGGLEVRWGTDYEEGNEALVIEWVETNPAGGDVTASQSRWAAWIEEAIAHQLSGRMARSVTPSSCLARLILPAAVMITNGHLELAQAEQEP
ncbi:HWE histidine kinase domain-containing protein [Mangrovicella endophytica]|uniref:HWE histidine kinase domain-containing protein n=1 Tax=Mangrovicella endophytica TaxID=2066697 RepID=UPI0018E43D05|nr:HWE histidine kinase domain-containing protein [Mangrovicella endophytica]